MSDYHINIFYSEEDGGYIADIPDLEFRIRRDAGASPKRGGGRQKSVAGSSPRRRRKKLTLPWLSGFTFFIPPSPVSRPLSLSVRICP